MYSGGSSLLCQFRVSFTLLVTDSRLLLTDWQHQTLQSLVGTEAEVRLTNQLNQRRIARECAKWIRGKVEVKASREPHQFSQNLIHLMANGSGDHFAVHGSATLTPTGLGEVRSNGLQMNTGTSDATSRSNYWRGSMASGRTIPAQLIFATRC